MEEPPKAPTGHSASRHLPVADFKQRVLWYVAVRWLILLVVAAPNITLQYFFPSADVPLRANFLLAIAVTAYNTGFWLIARKAKKRWLLTAVAVAQVLVDVASITFLAYRNGGLDSHSPLLYIVPILMSGLIWHRRAMITVAAAASAIYATVAIALFYGYLEPTASLSAFSPSDPHSFFSSLVFVVSALLLVAITSAYIINLLGSSEHSLRQIRQQLSQALHGQKEESSAFQARTRALLDSIGEGLIVVDEYGNITDINKLGEELLGYSKQELQGEWFPKAVKSVDASDKPIKPEDRAVVKALETGKPSKMRASYIRKNGDKLPVFSIAAPFLIDNRPAGVVVVFRDFRHEAAIEQAKDEFVSIVSHQLRTPLTSIRLFSDLLTDKNVGELNAQQKDYMDKIQMSVLRMVRLVNDILNISRIELGRLKIEPQKMQIEDVIKPEVDEITPVAKEKGISIEYVRPPKPLKPAPLDESLLGQIVHNMLTNAVRYSPAKTGKIKLELSQSSKGYQISVSDNGIGIPEAAKAKIFTRFFRADNAIAVEGEGTGLGLYLIKIILKEAGGRIYFESRQGRGTTFHVIIPLSGMRARAGEKSLS